MRAVRVPAALADRLGEAASAALVDMFDAHTRAVVETVMTQFTERFERRLVEETSKLRVEMAQQMAQLRTELREEMATNRVELLKWAFLFWVGQLVSVVGVVGLLIRTMPAR